MSTKLELLRRFQDNAGCSYEGPQRKARKAWRQLTPYLTDAQGRRLRVAWSHARMGEGEDGRGDLDSVCAQIREDWK